MHRFTVLTHAYVQVDRVGLVTRTQRSPVWHRATICRLAPRALEADARLAPHPYALAPRPVRHLQCFPAYNLVLLAIRYVDLNKSNKSPSQDKKHWFVLLYTALVQYFYCAECECKMIFYVIYNRQISNLLCFSVEFLRDVISTENR